ncbi:hypothetical protein UFOVP130_55 [uncultured Caudovirales phage]|uniref:DNMP kinase n=1 Tax=uncultured Caudovirales phage TaxID=2100421 RepID=A0A6J5LD16_9CAUD|nr:hypothetical protein UFOVP130_55 [uncultured Caudovirales phage]
MVIPIESHPKFRPDKPRIIGLCGHMGVGKDAAAAMLSMIGYTRIAFADQVRDEVADCIQQGMVPKKAMDRAYLPDDIRRASVEEVWAKPTSERMRRILQWWGTEYRRDEDPDYWTRSALKLAEAIPYCVFSDVRFPNEVQAIRDRGGVVWKIQRETFIDGIPGHASELAVDDITPDLTIENTGHLIDLAGKLRALLAA